MKALALTAALFAHLVAMAGSFTLRVSAAEHKEGEEVVLYRCDDLFTLRTVRIAEAVLDEAGNAVLTGDADGTTKARLRIGQSQADLYLRPGSSIHVRFLPTGPGTRKGPGGLVQAEIEFVGLDRMDVNALISDLNERIDTFLAEDLATDEDAGMRAAGTLRTEGKQAPADTAWRPTTLFVAPTWSTARVDTFERKLRRFYGEVRDPWFEHYLAYSLAGMRLGPRTNDRDLYERHLKAKPLRYDDPEFVRFVRSLFEDVLLVQAQSHGAALQRALTAADADSLKAIFGRNAFLNADKRLCELVMLDQLYLNHNSRLVPRGAAARVLERAAASSEHPEHRAIAANMLWDLTAMRPGSPLPPMRLTDLQGRRATVDSLLTGPVCIVLTESRCTYCELELAGLEKLKDEYGKLIPIIAISLDPTADEAVRYRQSHPGQDFHWFRAEQGQRLREDLRVLGTPAFFLLNDGILARSPAPLPSAGLGALFHRARVEAEERGRIKVWDD